METAKFSLRAVSDDDHEWLVELHNDPEVLNNTRDPRPITLDGHLRWWNSVKGNSKERRLIFCVDGQRVGFTKFYSIDFYNRHCILGADIHPSYRGNGYAKKMWSLMLDYCFNDLSLHRVGLSTMDYNKIAKKVYYGIGFKEEGIIKHCHYRDGEYHDAISMYMLESDWKNQ